MLSGKLVLLLCLLTDRFLQLCDLSRRILDLLLCLLNLLLFFLHKILCLSTVGLNSVKL